MTELQKAFNSWVHDAMPATSIEGLKAFCFNIFEDDTTFLVELIATATYDIEDELCDWACDEIWSSGDVMFILPHAEVGTAWEEVQETICIFVEDLIETECPASDFLQKSQAVAVGFIDGDIELVWNE